VIGYQSFILLPSSLKCITTWRHKAEDLDLKFTALKAPREGERRERDREKERKKERKKERRNKISHY
jgi:hypothetical protein